MKSSVVLVVLFSALNVWAGAQSLEPVKVAYFGGLSGRNSAASQKSLTALKIAVDQFNMQERPGVPRVEVLPFDNQSIPAKNLPLFEQAVKEGVRAILGVHISNDALLLAEQAEKAQIPMIVASATNPEVSRGRSFVAQVCFTDEIQGSTLARFAYERLGARRIALIQDISDQASARVARVFSEALRPRGGVEIRQWSIRTGDHDFSRLVAELAAFREADLIFLSASSLESAFLMRQLRAAGVDKAFLGTDNWQNQDFGKLMHRLGLEGVRAHFPAHWYSLIPGIEATKFVKDFKGRDKSGLGDFDADAALTYDAAGLFLAALESTFKSSGVFSPRKIMATLRGSQRTGVTGVIRFDSQGMPIKAIHMLEIHGGRLVSKGAWE